MITPRFKLSQSDDSLTIKIRAPYCCLRELDIHVEQSEFIFVCKPYYLRLILPGDIEDDKRKNTSFDSDSGKFTLTYPKKIHGEHFKDLDLLTKLLVPKADTQWTASAVPVEVLDEDKAKKPKPKKHPNTEHHDYGFGFGLRAQKEFLRINSELEDVFEIDPSEVPIKERRKLRVQYEQGKFDSYHYLADYHDNDEVCEIISLKCPFMDKERQKELCEFTDKELDFLKDLPNIQYELSEEYLNYCFNGLIDILYAYCFNYRISSFEDNVEAGWNICKLSSTLSWLDVFTESKDVMITAFRRSMIFPLYRHFDLAQMAFDDLKALIPLGEVCIIKVLLEIYETFFHGDCNRYVLNSLFIKDYIVFVMNWDKELWKAQVTDLFNVKIKKRDLGLNLDEIEEGCTLLEQQAAIRIDALDSDDSDSTSSSTDSDDSSD